MTPEHETGGSPGRPPLLATLCFALTALRRTIDAVAILLLAAMTFLVLAQILGRYAFNYAISWSEESATFVQVWLVALGAGIAMRNRQHVGIDFIIAKFPYLVQSIVKGGGLILAAWFLLAVIVGSMSMMTLGMIVKSPALQIPLAVPYLAIPVGMAYFLLELVVGVVPEVVNPEKYANSVAGGFE